MQILNTHFMQLVTAILTLLGFGLMLKLSEKLLEAGALRLN